MRIRILSLLAVLTLLALAAPSTMAAALGQESPGESNLGYLLVGTFLTWAGFFAYAFYIGRKNRDLRNELEELRRTIAQRDDAP